MDKNKFKIALTTRRVESLSDGIFAIAMTILIFGIEIPKLASPTDSDLLSSLINLWPDFLHYVESFIVLGVFWMQHHHQFHLIKRTDAVLILLNIVGLMFVALIPFSTALVGDLGHMRVASAAFNLNLLATGLVFFVHWCYATSGHRLVDPDMDIKVIRFYKMRNLVIPAAAAIVLCLSFFSPRWSTLVYFAAPFVLIFHKLK